MNTVREIFRDDVAAVSPQLAIRPRSTHAVVAISDGTSDFLWLLDLATGRTLKEVPFPKYFDSRDVDLFWSTDGETLYGFDPNPAHKEWGFRFDVESGMFVRIPAPRAFTQGEFEFLGAWYDAEDRICFGSTAGEAWVLDGNFLKALDAEGADEILSALDYATISRCVPDRSGAYCIFENQDNGESVAGFHSFRNPTDKLMVPYQFPDVSDYFEKASAIGPTQEELDAMEAGEMEPLPEGDVIDIDDAREAWKDVKSPAHVDLIHANSDLYAVSEAKLEMLVPEKRTIVESESYWRYTAVEMIKENDRPAFVVLSEPIALTDLGIAIDVIQ